jgi:hypothetical protein
MEEKCILIFKYFEIQLFYLTAIVLFLTKIVWLLKTFPKNNRSESFERGTTKDSASQVWLELATWFQRRCRK